MALLGYCGSPDGYDVGSRLELRCALEHRGYPEVGGERKRERCLGVLAGGGRGLVEGRDQD